MINLDRPLGIAEILDLPLQLIRREYRALLPVALVGSLVATLPTMAPQVMLLFGPATNPSYAVLVQIVNFATVMISLLLSLVATLAIVYSGRAVLEGQPVTMGQAFSKALSPSVFGTMLLAGLLVVVGICLCCLPGLVVQAYISLLAPLMVYEPPRGRDAIERAFRLAHFNPGPGLASWTITRIVLLWIVVSLVSYAVSFLISLPFMGAAGFLTFKQAAEGGLVPGQQLTQGMALATIITQLLTSVVQGATRLYSVIAFTLLYLNVRNLREGRDLEARLIERLNARSEEE